MVDDGWLVGWLIGWLVVVCWLVDWLVDWSCVRGPRYVADNRGRNGGQWRFDRANRMFRDSSRIRRAFTDFGIGEPSADRERIYIKIINNIGTQYASHARGCALMRTKMHIDFNSRRGNEKMIAILLVALERSMIASNVRLTGNEMDIEIREITRS